MEKASNYLTTYYSGAKILRSNFYGGSHVKRNNKGISQFFRTDNETVMLIITRKLDMVFLTVQKLKFPVFKRLIDIKQHLLWTGFCYFNSLF